MACRVTCRKLKLVVLRFVIVVGLVALFRLYTENPPSTSISVEILNETRGQNPKLSPYNITTDARIKVGLIINLILQPQKWSRHRRILQTLMARKKISRWVSPLIIRSFMWDVTILQFGSDRLPADFDAWCLGLPIKIKWAELAAWYYMSHVFTCSIWSIKCLYNSGDGIPRLWRFSQQQLHLSALRSWIM